MKISFPTPSTYFIGLAIAVVLVGLGALLANPLQLATLELPWLLAIGAVFGHLIGALLHDTDAGQAPRPARAAQPTTTPGGDAKGRTTLYVGNLAFRTTRREFEELFARYGKVYSARIMTDRATRKPRGFGFIEMDMAGAAKAIATLNDQDFNGRTLKVNEASERGERNED